MQTIILPGVAVHRDGLSRRVWPVVVVTGALFRCNAFFAVTYLKRNRRPISALCCKNLMPVTLACKDNTPPTVPGGHRHPGIQARLTHGKSRFWQVLAHSRPFSPASQSVRMSGGGHCADLRSACTKTLVAGLHEVGYQAIKSRSNPVLPTDL